MDYSEMQKILHGFGNYDPPRCVKCGMDCTGKKHFVGHQSGKWLCAKCMTVYQARQNVPVVGTKAEAIQIYMRRLISKGDVEF